MTSPQVDPPAAVAGTGDGARRAEVLDTAASLIASSGMRTSLKEIADACGILPGSLYHHFDSKEAIFVELIDRYRADLDRIAQRVHDRLHDPSAPTIARQIDLLAGELAGCALRHRAALLLTFYEPPTGAGSELVRAAQHTPTTLTTAMVAVMSAGHERGYLRDGIDLEALADRFGQAMLHIGLGVLGDTPGADRVPEIRCRILFDGIAARPPSDVRLDSSDAMAAARLTIESWDEAEREEDERFALLRSVARTEFGRKGYEATTVRDIASAAGVSTGSVYRLVGSKDALLDTIMTSFVTRMRRAWKAVLASDSSALEKLDALLWTDINVVDRFSDEFNIQVAWLREAPPVTANLGSSFSARLRNLKALLAEGRREGEVDIEAPSADLRAWSLFELLWMPENIVHEQGPARALDLARNTVMRGAAAPT